MQIDVYADVVCPWCYIGERRLEKAIAERPNLIIERRWRPFQLQPTMPTSGLSWKSFISQKFGGEARANSAFAQVTELGAEEGITLDFTKVATAPNTVDAHRLILLARQAGLEWEMANRLFAAYFAEGRNLNQLEDLLLSASEVGLDAEAVRNYLQTEEDKDAVEVSQENAARQRIQGVPYYIFDNHYAISGAQPVEVFLQVIDKLAEQPQRKIWAINSK